MVPLRKATDAVHWFLSELGARVFAESGILSDRRYLGKLILRSLRDAPDFILQPLRKATDAVHWFLSELGARVVAESGIPSDRHHLGKLILRSLRDAPDFILQIDAATGESETNRSALQRTVQCAIAFKKLGLKEGDNIILLAPNHIHLTIPYYAALYLGIGIAPLDAFLTVGELELMFKMIGPKVIFCQNERAPSIKEALNNTQLKPTVVTFDDSDECIKFSNFLEKYGHDADIEAFRGSNFDPVETNATLLATSGTTGLPKAASLTHANFMHSLPYLWLRGAQFPTPTRLALVCSPLQWLSAVFHFLFSPIVRYTRLQSSDSITSETFVEIVNKYKPSSTVVSPPLLTMLTRPENVSKCDISCFELILIGGSAVSKELLESVRKISPNTFLLGVYGTSEIGGLAFYDDEPVPGSMGRPVGLFDYRLVDTNTKEDITEPNVNGELWLRGPSVCKGYYNQPEVTKEAFEEGGWIRTGDIFYRDENYFFFFVERLKLLLKYRNHQISPLELETVIREHPGVLDVAVTGIVDKEAGDLPVACVVRRSGYNVTAQEIKDLVKNSLTDTKQLRGGVVFMKEFPMTASTKVHRRLLKEIVPNMTRE